MLSWHKTHPSRTIRGGGVSGLGRGVRHGCDCAVGVHSGLTGLVSVGGNPEDVAVTMCLAEMSLAN